MNKAAIACLLGISLTGANARAETPADFFVESDRFDSEDVIPGSEIGRYQYAYVKWMLESDYPIPSIMLHSINRGMSISDVVYLLTLTDTTQAQLIYDSAMDLLPQLPSWACQDNASLTGRYFPRYRAEDLDGQPSVRAVANKYFESGARLSPFPQWRTGKGHFDASTAELIELAEQEQKDDGQEVWWYQPGDARIAENAPVFVSLYPENKLIAVDAGIRQLQGLQRAGQTRTPVVIVYNRPGFIPTSAVGKAADSAAAQGQAADDRITARDVIDRYLKSSDKVTPVRERRAGDYHIMAQTDEIAGLFDLPQQAHVPAERWNQLRDDMQQSGFGNPLQITVHGDSGRTWAKDPERVSVAQSLGIKQIPTVFFFHELRRWPCGIPSACDTAVCNAAVAAGASPGICSKQDALRGRGQGFPRSRGAALASPS